MKTSTETLIAAMRILATEIQSDDGAANAAVAEAGERLAEQHMHIKQWHDALTPLMPSDFKCWHENTPNEWPEVTARVITSQRERITQLEQENDAMRADLLLWNKAGIGFTTEDKP